MRFRPVGLAILMMSLLWVTGCGPSKLSVSKEFKLDGEHVAQAIDLPAQPKPQTIKVEFASPSNDVSVYVFKEEDARGEDGILGANSKKALAAKTGSRGDTFTVDVPADTATRVIIRGGGRTSDVSLKLSN